MSFDLNKWGITFFYNHYIYFSITKYFNANKNFI